MRVKKHISLSAFALAVMLFSISAHAQINSGMMSPPANTRPPRLENVGIEQHLDAQVPPDLAFQDETGKNIRLGDYFGRKPIILNLVYYNCTMLCGEALAGLASAMRLVKFDVGNQFDVVTVSFDPRETPEMAAAKKLDYVKRYGRPNAAAGWHFLTGSSDSINALTKTVGFQYQYDEKSKQYAHATAIMVLTPQGRISRYFYGVDFPPKDLRMGLVEASEGKIGNPVDAVLLYCYHYDPATGKYGAMVGNILKLAAAATILLLGGLLLILWRLDRAATEKLSPAAGLGFQPAMRKALARQRRHGMLNNFPLWPEQASTLAGHVDALYIFLLLITGGMAALVFACIIFFAAKFRYRPGVPAEQIEGSTPLEVTWSIIPFLVFMVIFAWGAIVFFKERTPPADSTEVYVVAKQWMWKVEHAEGQREINELHVPVGRDVKLIMTSQDVIHSFYIPAFRIKQDVLPGRYTVEWFKATKPGVYHLFCAEYCGTQHSGMVGNIVVQEPAQYQAWMNSGSNGPLSASGEKVFAELGCAACHRSNLDGNEMPGRGPNLHGVFGHPVQLEDGRTVTADENYVRESILDPGAKRIKGFAPIMPTFQGLVNEEQLNALVAYIKSISNDKPGVAAKSGAGGISADPLREATAQAEAQTNGIHNGSQVQ